MATKFGLAGGIPERRVRPIWDAVDSRQFKAALKLSTSLLSKYPNSPYALALRALILERMGKLDEALSVCLNAKEQLYSDEAVQIDDLTLSTLQIVFQRLDRLDLATSCYEYACGKFTNNLELMMGLFNCYVREYSYVKQQQTAIKMYKVVSEERFLLWAICSIQLQVLCGDGGEKLLLLAEALLKKHTDTHSLHEPEALFIYISILEQQGKYGAALEILSGKLGSLLSMEGDKLRLQGRLLAHAHDYAAAAEIFQKVLESWPDDWESFLHYLDCLLEDDSSWCKKIGRLQMHGSKVVDSSTGYLSHMTDEVFDSRIMSGLNFVQKLQMEATSDSIRGPFLANIEIEKRCRMRGKPDDGQLMVSLLHYFSRFGHLACFTSDVEISLQVLTQTEKTKFLEEILKTGKSLLDSPQKALGKAMTSYKIQESIGVSFILPILELQTNAKQLAGMYCGSLPLSKDLDPQENMHGEDLLVMVCNVLVQLFWRTRHLGYLLEAIMVLEFGLTIRRYVWQYKILLLHLYSYICAFPSAYDWYKTLEIKNILLETVSHHILPQMLNSPFWCNTTDLLNDYLKFMDDHFKEAADLTFLAYRHRNYTKVIEFVQFRERLRHSFQYLMIRIEAPILKLKQKAVKIEEVECILESLDHGVELLELANEQSCKSMTFNEDLQSRPWWTPTPDKNYLLGAFKEGSLHHRKCLANQHAKERETQLHVAIERRSLLPSLIALSIQSTSLSQRENIEANGILHDGKISSELNHLLGRYAMSLGKSFDDAVKLMSEILEGQEPPEEISTCIIDWMNFAVFLNAYYLSLRDLSVPQGSGLDPWRMVDYLIEKCTSQWLHSIQPLLKCPCHDLLLLVQMVTETFSWHSLVIQSCVRSLQPSGKKKKRSSGSIDQSWSLLSEVRISIDNACRSLEKVISWLKEQLDEVEDVKLEFLLSLIQKKGSDGPGLILEILEAEAATRNPVGDWISQMLQSWNSVEVARKIIKSQSSVLSQFFLICDSKLKSMRALRQLIH